MTKPEMVLVALVWVFGVVVGLDIARMVHEVPVRIVVRPPLPPISTLYDTIELSSGQVIHIAECTD